MVAVATLGAVLNDDAYAVGGTLADAGTADEAVGTATILGGICRGASNFG